MKVIRILLICAVTVGLANKQELGLHAQQPAVYSPLGASVDATISQIQQMYDCGNYTAVIYECSNLMPKMASYDANMATAKYLYAMSLYHSGDTGAATYLEEFIEQYPGSALMPQARMALANRYFYSGDYGRAVAEYRALPAETINGTLLADRYYRMGYCELRLGEYDKAKKDFILAACDKRYVQAQQFYKAYISYATGDYAGALSGFAKIGTGGELGRNARYYMCQLYFHNQDYSTACALAKTLLAESVPADFAPELNRVAGESEYRLGNSNEAVSYLNRYVDLCNDASISPMRSAMYVLGLICRERGDNAGVVKYMTDATATFADALAQSAYLYLGQAYVALENYAAASLAFERAMNMEYDRQVAETAFYNYAVAQNRGTRTPFGSAIRNFEEFLNRYPNSGYKTQVEEFLIDAYIHGNDYAHALESINRIQNPSVDLLKAKQYVLYNLGINAHSCGDNAEALDYLQQALNLGNYNNGVWLSTLLWLGDCCYEKGDYAAAENYYTTFTSTAKRSDSSYWKGLYNLAYSKYQQRKYKAARTDFQKTITSRSSLDDATKADAYSRIADTYYYAKSYPDAASNYTIAISLNSDGADYPMLRKAIVLGLMKQQQGKIALLDALLAKYPQSPLCASALLEKAEAQIAVDNGNAATATFMSLLDKYPQTPEARKALLRLAITNKNLGDENAAIANYKSVISKYPSSEEAAIAVEDLKIIYAGQYDIASLERFLASVPNAPQLKVDEVDRLEFAAAERAYIGEKEDISRMQEYLRRYPQGQFRSNALYYMATEEYKTDNFDAALEHIDAVLENAADASFAENALAMKGAILARAGRHAEAFETFKVLAGKAAVAENRTRGKLGVMRSGFKTRRYKEVIEYGNSLLTSSGGTLGADDLCEVYLLRANAYAETGNEAAAIADWQRIAEEPRSVYGAQGAIALAQHYYDNKLYDNAEHTLNSLIDSGTPHTYWLARGFILLSDVLEAKGNRFEAREYLESLKNNYPGNELEIFDMIDSRLKKLK